MQLQASFSSFHYPSSKARMFSPGKLSYPVFVAPAAVGDIPVAEYTSAPGDTATEPMMMEVADYNWTLAVGGLAAETEGFATETVYLEAVHVEHWYAEVVRHAGDLEEERWIVAPV